MFSFCPARRLIALLLMLSAAPQRVFSGPSDFGAIATTQEEYPSTHAARMLQLDDRCDINAVFLEIGVLRYNCPDFCGPGLDWVVNFDPNIDPLFVIITCLAPSCGDGKAFDCTFRTDFDVGNPNEVCPIACGEETSDCGLFGLGRYHAKCLERQDHMVSSMLTPFRSLAASPGIFCFFSVGCGVIEEFFGFCGCGFLRSLFGLC